jgi:amino acid adenylation domain-containing protein
MINALFLKLKKLKINLQHIDGRLDVNAPKDVLSPALLEEIKSNKEGLIELLDSYKKKKDAHRKIYKIAEQSHYELSSSQIRLWMLSQLGAGNIAYNIAKVYVFEGDLDRQSLANSFGDLIERHESLRTVFREDEHGNIRQFIKTPTEAGFTIEYRDLGNEEETDKNITRLVETSLAQPFELSEGPLLRATLYRVGDNKHIFTYVMHHIISDAWSMDILIRELGLFYNARISGRKDPLPPLHIQYKDYAAWQQGQLRGEVFQVHKDYWLKQFEGDLPVTELLADKARPSVKTYNGAVLHKKINAGLLNRIKDLVQEQECTLFMGLLGVVTSLLYKYTYQQDIIVGTTITGREYLELEDQIGFYVNTLALRTKFKKESSYNEILGHVKQVTLGGYEHQTYPFDELVNELNLHRDLSRNPLFDILVELEEDSHNRAEGLSKIKISGYHSGNTVLSKFDLRIVFIETEEGLDVVLEYNTDLYEIETIELFGKNFEQLLSAVLRQPDTPVNKLDYIFPEDKHRLLAEFNDTTVDYTGSRSVIKLFEEQVERTPDQIAVLFQGVSLTYRELDEKSNQLANYLIENDGIRPGDLVGIMLDRSEKMIIAILGVLKSGAAYIPIDADYPRHRRRHILQDTAIKVLLTQAEYIYDLEYSGAALFAMDIQLDGISCSIRSPRVEPRPEDLAYVIYTSGSTGAPKGCAITNGNLFNYIQWANDYYFGQGGGVSFGLYTSLSFDLTITSIFCPLTRGGNLTVFGQHDDIAMILRKIFSAESHINSIKLTPSHINILGELDIVSSTVSCAIVGGEEVTSGQVKILKRMNPSINIYNEYGPTETTVGCIVKRLEENMPVLIGKPICNTSVYILGANDELCPTGVPGEIYISGAGVGQGYLNQPELTAEKFLLNLFKPGERMYRTGDWGRWLDKGEIQFLGRKDSQIKIRGYRIELGEIEKALLDYDAIRAVVVVVKPNMAGDKELVAYIVSDETLSIFGLTNYLAGILPVYMMPAHYVQIDSIPLTQNGKTDKNALPDPGSGRIGTGVEYIAARNDIEERLISIWQDVLERERISVKDNFFDLGGHSLKATRLASQIFKKFNVKVELQDLFSKVTLEEQAGLIEHAKRTLYSEIPPVKLQSCYGLSSSQRRLWVLSQFEEGNIAYNMPGTYVFEGNLDPAILKRSLDAIIDRHEIMRTVFREDGQGNVMQYILSPEEIGSCMPCHDLQKEALAEEKLRAAVEEQAIEPFDLRAGPLFRVNLYQVADSKWVLNYVMHHIISDGWSMVNLINELLSVYHTYESDGIMPLPPLRIQYKDFASWQQDQLEGDAYLGHKAYWMKQFEGELPVLELPGYRPRPAVKSYKGGVITKSLSPNLVKGIRGFSQGQNATLFMGLLAGVVALLYRYTGHEDIVIGSPIAGREHIDLEDQIGFYVNTLALRARFKGEDNGRKLLENIRQTTLGAYEHQAYPFDELVGELNLQRDMSRNALFDVMVVLQNMQMDNIPGQMAPGMLKAGEYNRGDQVTSKFDLLFNFSENGDALQASIEYNSDIYDKNAVERMIVHLEQIFVAITANPLTEIQGLNYLTEAEKKTLLIMFNDTKLNYTRTRTVLNLFEEQAEQLGHHRTALVFQDIRLTYGELNERSNQLARYIRNAAGARRGDCVAVLIERSEWSVICMIGIMKAGCIYVPIERSLSDDRINYILADSKSIAVIINDPGARESIGESENLKFLELGKMPTDVDRSNPGLDISGVDSAFIIYTSGSTGNPKGVEQTHGMLLNLIFWDIDGIQFNESMRHLQFSSFSFDSSIHDVYYVLATAGEVHLVNETLRRELWDLKDYIVEKGISTVSMPYAALKSMFGEIPPGEFNDHCIEEIISTGEQLYVTGGLREFLKDNPSVKIYNLYGPSETHVVTGVAYSFSEGEIPEKASIGSPIYNTTIYILDKNMRLVPIGVEGEIFIGGWNLAKGYAGKPDLTAERFIGDPFKKGELIYRSGDIGKWRPNGEIEYIGRRDNQVKINGYRIELGEIENALRNDERIEESVVVTRESASGDKILVAYMVTKAELNLKDVRRRLRKSLPAYMLPHYFIQLKKMPLTVNGKVDTRSLPAPEESRITEGLEYVAPRDMIESGFVEIWSDILGIDREKIGVTNSFFELGGHSLLATKLVNRIHKEFGIKVTLKDMLMEPTIESMSIALGALLWVKGTENMDQCDLNTERLIF